MATLQMKQPTYVICLETPRESFGHGNLTKEKHVGVGEITNIFISRFYIVWLGAIAKFRDNTEKPPISFSKAEEMGSK